MKELCSETFKILNNELNKLARQENYHKNVFAL